jgi:tetratricopeptide (TPR) repeat protein
MLANTLIDDIVAAGQAGLPVDEPAAEALAAVEKAAVLNPFSPDVPLARGRVHDGVAVSRRLAGREEDAQDAFRKAVEAFDLAAALDGELAEAVAHRASTRARRAAGAYSEERAAEGEKAVADATAALAMAPGMVSALEARGMARANLASYRRIRGLDGLELYREAVADYEAAAAVERPQRAQTLADLGITRLNYASHLAELGGRAKVAFEAAMADFDRALALDGRLASAWAGRAQTRTVLAVVGQNADGFRKAIDDATQAVTVDARPAAGWSARASARRQLGDLRIQLAPDEAAELYREAVKDADEAIRRAPGDLAALFERAASRDHLGLTMHMRNEDAADEYEAAVKDYRAILKAAPGRLDVLMMHGAACANLGGWLERRGGDAEGAYREGIASFEAVLKVQPAHAQVKQHLESTKAALRALKKE